MSKRPQVGIGAIHGGTIGGRDIARAVAAGVSQAGEGIAPGSRVRIGMLSVQAGEGADPRRVSVAVKREIERALRRRAP